MRFNVKKLTAAMFAAAMMPGASCSATFNENAPRVCATGKILSDVMSDSNYVNFVNTLKNQSDDFLHILRSGDAGFGKDSVDIVTSLADVSKLRATQNEIGLSDSLLFVLNPSKATKGAIGDSSQYILDILRAKGSDVLRPMNQDIIVAGNDIIDGHHRWSTVALLNPDVKIGTLNIKGAKDAIHALKITQSAILATQGTINTAGKQGVNMLEMPEEDIYNYVRDNISKTVLQDLMAFYGVIQPIDAVSILTKVIMRNLSSMKEKNVNTQFDISRTYMPQTDRGGIWLDALRTGKVNVSFGGGRRKRVSRRSYRRRSYRKASSRRYRRRSTKRRSRRSRH